MTDLVRSRPQILQVHIKHSGTANMLLNTSKLPGINKKKLAVAEREKKVSKTSSQG
jgi:hypothetical protein